MGVTSRLNGLLREVAGLEVRRLNAHSKPGGRFSEDGLRAKKTVEMFAEPRFVHAYNRAVQAAGWDYQIHWRTHIALWAAEQGPTGTRRLRRAESGTGMDVFSNLRAFAYRRDEQARVPLRSVPRLSG